jgi:hypothetical protein
MIIITSTRINLKIVSSPISDNTVRVFANEEILEEYLNKFADDNKVNRSIISVDKHTIPNKEFDKIKNHVLKFRKETLSMEELIYCIYSFNLLSQ